MSYYFSRIINCSFEAALNKVADGLKQEGFGILTEIDVKETLKKKLDVDFKKYKILGACNPPFAYKALLAEEKVGTMLPCNVILIEKEENKIEVSAVNPVASMKAIKNRELAEVAEIIRNKLKKVVDNLS